MNQDPEKRHTSSEDELIDALEKLEATLEPSDSLQDSFASRPLSLKTPAKPAATVPPPPKKYSPEFLLSALEDAAADIDQFMAAKHKDAERS
jgi:hypothetical protein